MAEQTETLTEEQWSQLREILITEGFDGIKLEMLLADFRRKPKLSREVLSNWKLVTETKH